MAWLDKTENIIKQAEPVDLTDELEVIEAKYNKFRVSILVRILYKAVIICILNTCSCQYLKHYSPPAVYWKDILKFIFYLKLLC